MNLFLARIIVIVLLSTNYVALAQDLNINKATGPIKVDGVMDEGAWLEADVADKFIQNFPTDTALATGTTEVRMTYDDKNLYIIAIMHNIGPRDYVVQSLRRDTRGITYDGFYVILDTYKDKTNAFLFSVSPYGVQSEGLIVNGGNESGGGRTGLRSYSMTWDNKWLSEAKIYDDYWIAEIAIPFKTIRFKDNEDTWNVNFLRYDSEYGERSSWSPIPKNFRSFTLAFNKELKWDKPINSPGKNISLIPYSALKASKNYEDNLPGKAKFTFGGDAKVALSSALNLDLTVNPDFSQVEADQQVTDLDRFELFYPEQRQFFLENSDLFAAFGSSDARPFFSRRIGLARDTATGTNIMNQLYFGARTSGNITNRLRIGLMSIQAAEEKEISLPSTNYSVASLQQMIGQRSNISMLFVNKQAFQNMPGDDFTLSPDEYNRTLALDLNLATPDNKWNGKGYYHRSFDNEKRDSTYSLGVAVNFKPRKWSVSSEYKSVAANFNPKVGFVRRTDFNQIKSTIYHYLYPSNGKVQSHAPGFDFDVLSTGEYGITDWDVNLLYRLNFRNTSRFSIRLRRQYTYLTSSYDPSGSDGPELPEGTDYAYNFIIASYDSDGRKAFSYELETRSGQYFNGIRLNFGGELTYRFTPKGYLSLNFDMNRIRLPEPYHDSNLFLFGPKLDLTFTRNVFWTTFIQYNSQINNVNINSRFQWRYKPASDMYLVYTDNYFAGDGTFINFNRPKTRAIVFKINYWFNT